MNTEQHIPLIYSISKKIAPKYVFPGYEVDDIVQEAAIIGIKSLEKFDESKGNLSAYLYVHISNRLKTFKRDNYLRPLEVCKECGGVPACPACLSRLSRNTTKHSLLAPSDLSDIDKEAPESPDSLEVEELSNIILGALPMEMRADYMRMLDGVYVPKKRRILIEKEIHGIFEEYERGTK